MNKITRLNKTRGAGMLTTVIFVLMLIVFGIVGMKVIPAYSNEFAIQKALNDVAVKNKDNQDIASIKSSIQKRWTIDYINNLEPKEVKFQQDNGVIVMSYDYEVVIPLFKNMSILLKFDKVIKIV